MRQRLRKVVTLSAVALMVAGCASGRAGTPIPDGDDVAEYVSAKFSSTLEQLDDDLSSNEPRQSTLRSFMRIGEKKADNTVTAIQVGSPPDRFYKNHSNRDSADFRDYFRPAGSEVEYIMLGPEYAELAPTQWVSMPYKDEGLNACYWGGYLTVCRMLSAVTQAMQDTSVEKKAKSLADGSTELTIAVSLEVFIEQRIVVIPDWALEQIGDALLDGEIDTRILLDPDGELKEIEMNGLVSEDGGEVEIKQHYQVLDTPTEHDIPAVPSDDDVTELTSKKEISEFYDAMSAITSSEG